MDIEEKLSRLKDASEKTAQAKMKAELSRDAALVERDKALSELRDSFGVDSVEDAEKKLEALKELLDKAIKEAESALGGMQ